MLLSLFAALLAGFLVGAGPTMWFALIVGLAVLGGDPSDPLTAVAASALTFLAANAVRTRVAKRLYRR